jgi:signal transduction histidine kinase
VVAWNSHTGAVTSLVDAQLVTTQALLATPEIQRDPAKLLMLAGRPEVNVIVRDTETGAIYNYLDGAVAAAPGPPRDGRAQAGPPPRHDQPPLPPGSIPGYPAELPPPPAPPPPAMAGPRPGRRSQLAVTIASMARVMPRQATAGVLTVTLVPSAIALMRWFFADVIICALAMTGIAIAAWATMRALGRAAREPLLRTTAALEGLAGGNFTPQTIEAGDAPEIARLAHAYNAAAETVARSIEERRAATAEFQRFLADAGHELRTPLTIVGGYIDILGRGTRDDDATGRRVIAGMTAETARMRALVEKMLLLSRLETNVSEPRVVEVASVSDEVAEAMRPGFPGRIIVVKCDAAARIHIDEDDLFEAERNLVENALRYAPDSAIEVRASEQGGLVAIEVADTGPGIPEGEQAMIFERFYRGKDRTDSEGSGLGLAIVRRVVERWGGTISLISGPRGTRFIMRFPVAQASA